MTRTAFLVAIVAIALSSCISPASGLRSSTSAVPLWGRWEGAFAAIDPRGEVHFGVRLTSPSGDTRDVVGFWDGGPVWRVRFMPHEEGLWTYETFARPYTAGLSDQRGTFVCHGRSAHDNPLFQHGPVLARPGESYFSHQDGTPFFWMGDTAWNGVLRASRAEWDQYLADRRGRRFSVIQFVATQWRGAAADRLGIRAYHGYDSITINPEFFRRMDARIDQINRHGLIAAPVMLWELGDARTAPGQLPESEAIKLARYIKARYGAYHVAWILGGDADYGPENAQRWKRIGRAVFDETNRTPVFLHPKGMHWPWDAFVEEGWLNSVGYQSGHGDDEATLRWTHSGPAAQKWDALNGRPLVNLEPAYEDILSYHSHTRHSAHSVRRAVYWSLLSTPVAGVSYGAHGIWSWESAPGVPLNHDRSGIARPWGEAIAFPGGADMTHVVELFTSLDWRRLRPDANLVLNQPSDPARHVAAARASDGSIALVYLPAGGSVVLDPARVSTASQAAWFNPRDGRRSAASPSGPAQYVAPDAQDWVLVFTPRSVENP